LRILFLGDIVGRSGREAVDRHLPGLIDELAIDFVVANGENAAGGFGITAAICGDLFDLGVDVITTGNHVWDQREIVTHFARESRLLRPHNFPDRAPGTGSGVYALADGRKVLVINVMGRLFMDPLDDPFACVDQALADHRLGETVDAVVVDVHGEATSEKMALAHFLDGRATLVVGTHTHVPTADAVILDGGTAYQTDAGMCGDYNSVIGSQTDPWVNRFLTKMPSGRVPPADGEGTLSGVFVETVDRTGLARRIAPVVLGPRLENRRPE